MKANRKFVEGEEAVSAVIGVILMVAITVAIAATVYVYVSGMLGGSPSSSATISMVSKSGYVQITNIQNGPVSVDSVTLKILDSTGVEPAATVVDVAWGEGGTSGDNINGGDTIVVTDGTASSGDKFTVQLVATDGVLGEAPYTIP